MLSLDRVLLTFTVASLTLACQQTPSARGSLEGAWKAVHVSLESPDTSRAIPDPQPSLYLFSSSHYSIMFVFGSEPRALFQDMTEATDAEKIAAYESFTASSGTYTVSDSIIEARPIVAKNPNFVGQVQTYLYRLRGDSLWVTFRPLPAPELEVRVTLVRM